MYDWPAEWAGDLIFTPWEFCEQFNCIAASEDPSPLTVKVGAGSLSTFKVPLVTFDALIFAISKVP